MGSNEEDDIIEKLNKKIQMNRLLERQQNNVIQNKNELIQEEKIQNSNSIFQQQQKFQKNEDNKKNKKNLKKQKSSLDKLDSFDNSQNQVADKLISSDIFLPYLQKYQQFQNFESHSHENILNDQGKNRIRKNINNSFEIQEENAGQNKLNKFNETQFIEKSSTESQNQIKQKQKGRPSKNPKILSEKTIVSQKQAQNSNSSSQLNLSGQKVVNYNEQKEISPEDFNVKASTVNKQSSIINGGNIQNQNKQLKQVSLKKYFTQENNFSQNNKKNSSQDSVQSDILYVEKINSEKTFVDKLPSHQNKIKEQKQSFEENKDKQGLINENIVRYLEKHLSQLQQSQQSSQQDINSLPNSRKNSSYLTAKLTPAKKQQQQQQNQNQEIYNQNQNQSNQKISQKAPKSKGKKPIKKRPKIRNFDEDDEEINSDSNSDSNENSNSENENQNEKIPSKKQKINNVVSKKQINEQKKYSKITNFSDENLSEEDDEIDDDEDDEEEENSQDDLENCQQQQNLQKKDLNVQQIDGQNLNNDQLLIEKLQQEKALRKAQIKKAKKIKLKLEKKLKDKQRKKMEKIKNKLQDDYCDLTESDDSDQNDELMMSYDKEIKKYVNSYNQFRKNSQFIEEYNFFYENSPNYNSAAFKQIKITKPHVFWFIVCQQYFSRAFILQNTCEQALTILQNRIKFYNFTPKIRLQLDKNSLKQKNEQNQSETTEQIKQDTFQNTSQDLESEENIQQSEQIQEKLNVVKNKAQSYFQKIQQEKQKELENLQSYHQNTEQNKKYIKQYTFKDDMFILETRSIIVKQLNKIQNIESDPNAIETEENEQQQQDITKFQKQEEQLMLAKKLDFEYIENLLELELLECNQQNQINLQELRGRMEPEFQNYQEFFSEEQTTDDNSNIMYDLNFLTQKEQEYLNYLEQQQHNQSTSSQIQKNISKNTNILENSQQQEQEQQQQQQQGTNFQQNNNQNQSQKTNNSPKKGLPKQENITNNQINTLQQQQQQQQQQQKKHTQQSDVVKQGMLDYICKVCNEGDYDENNHILICEKCNISVHQQCYGLKKVPTGDWICDVCKGFGPKGKYLRCLLCTQRGGVMKQTLDPTFNCKYSKLNPDYYEYSQKCPAPFYPYRDIYKSLSQKDQKSSDLDGDEDTQDQYSSEAKQQYYNFYQLEEEDFIPKDLQDEPKSQNIWVHLSCASWIPECYLDERENQTIVKGVSKIDKLRFKLTCSICKSTRKGACIQCCKGKCQTAFHVECMRRANLCMEYRPQERVQYQAFCERHTPLKIKKCLAIHLKKQQKDIITFNKHAIHFYNIYIKNQPITSISSTITQYKQLIPIIKQLKPNIQISHLKEPLTEYDFYYQLKFQEEIVIRPPGRKKLKLRQKEQQLALQKYNSNSQKFLKNSNQRKISQESQISNLSDSDSDDSNSLTGQTLSKSDDSDSEEYSNFSQNLKKQEKLKKKQEKNLEKQRKKLQKLQQKPQNPKKKNPQNPKKSYPKRTGILMNQNPNSARKQKTKDLFSKQELENLQFPLQISNLVVLLNPGRIHLGDNYHSKYNLFPVGYKCKREYSSYLHLNVKTQYISEIFEGKNGKPLFRVTCQEDPDNFIQTESSSSCWKYIAEKVNQLRKGSKQVSISGPEMFALQNPKIQQVLYTLPNADKCQNYYQNQLNLLKNQEKNSEEEPKLTKKVKLNEENNINNENIQNNQSTSQLNQENNNDNINKNNNSEINLQKTESRN